MMRFLVAFVAVATQAHWVADTPWVAFVTSFSLDLGHQTKRCSHEAAHGNSTRGRVAACRSSSPRTSQARRPQVLGKAGCSPARIFLPLRLAFGTSCTRCTEAGATWWRKIRSYLKWCEKKVRCVFVVCFVSHFCSCNQNIYVAILLSQVNLTVESEKTLL